MLESMQRVLWYVQSYEKLFAQRQLAEFGEKQKKEFAEKRRELEILYYAFRARRY